MVPRGVYRFITFEEADARMTRMMAVAHANRRSKTSPASAAAEIADDDVARYTVVRVVDEVVVDLMATACGVDFNEAARDVQPITIGGVSIPVAVSRR